MTDRVVDFSDMKFRLRGKNYGESDRCTHINVTLDDEGGIVTCDACGKQLDAFLTLRRMCEIWGDHARRMETKAKKLEEESKAQIVLRAAIRIQNAWRGRKLFSTCPHCRAAIFPEDGFGESMINKEIELRRREVTKKKAASANNDNPLT